jgi:hypothetical protein
MQAVADCLSCQHVQLRPGSSRVRTALAVLAVFACGTLLADEPRQRVSDTRYGMALYEYHQGDFFQALTRLNVARAEGGISGHGDHPLLVEAGLMLVYGMTREAHTLLEALLDESDVSGETRNQAWFYMGKVFWLEADPDASADALARVDGDLLEETDETLYREWLYLKGQLLLGQRETPVTAEQFDEIFQQLPPNSVWSWYLSYNRAVQQLGAGDVQAAVDGLSALIAQAAPESRLPPETADELIALEQQVRLTLGRLHLGQGNFQQAMAVLGTIPLDGLMSDQALSDYAVAASRLGRNGLALQALETLQNRPLFTPWLQQVPYARAFTIEQMNQPEAALEAYRAAAGQYLRLDERLAEEQANLTEARLVEALNFTREAEDNGRNDGTRAAQNSAESALGESTMLIDTYGRVQVQPQDFSLAGLLAGEAFQLALRDLHELYRLSHSLDRWRAQLSSFDVMLDTRRSRREARILETRQALSSLNVDEWGAQQSQFRRRIEQASAGQDAVFFMSARQWKLRQHLDRVGETLRQLPDDDSTSTQRRTYKRMRAYFDWWVADDYSINRWAAISQLQELDEAMETFVGQRQLMEQEVLSDARLDEFADRISRKREELDQVNGMLEAALNQTRQDLLLLVDSELASQRRQIAGYLRASRHAQARLADRLLLGARKPTAADPTANQGIESRSIETEGADE